MPAKRVGNDPDKRIDSLHEAELKHQREIMESTIIVKDEEGRRSRVRSTILRDDVAAIRAQLSQQTDRYDKLSKQHTEARSKLVAAKRKSDEQDKRLKSQTREISNLKAELQSLNGVSQDSTKMLSEKLALTRELANLKPELEHLRSQLANHAEVLAAKLALERQINTLEVEVANEKRAAQRAIQRQEAKEVEVGEELRQQIQDLEKKLANEKRNAQRAQQDAENEVELEHRLRQQADEFEAQLKTQQTEATKARRELERQLAKLTTQNEFIDERFTELKAKLKETRQELKSCRAELQEARQWAANRVAKAPVAAKAKGMAQPGPKRRAEEMAQELDILASPTIDEKRTKKPLKKRVEALAGEKSMFSITPFLTKTISFAEGPVEFTAGGNNMTCMGEEDDQDDFMDDTFAGHQSIESAVAETTAQSAEGISEHIQTQKAQAPVASKPQPKSRGRPKIKVALHESPWVKQNLSLTSNCNTSKEEQTETLEKVVEEAEENGDQENRTVAMPSITAATRKKATQKKTNAAAIAAVVTSKATVTVAEGTAVETEPKKKKRKLLAGAPKTLFEDEEEAEAAPVAKRQPGKVQLGKVQMSGAGARAFAGKAFSPLKRDRRGVNASFLT